VPRSLGRPRRGLCLVRWDNSAMARIVGVVFFLLFVGGESIGMLDRCLFMYGLVLLTVGMEGREEGA
jgi:hypothetical protein